MVMKRSATSTRSSTPDLDASSDFAPSPPSSNLVSTPKKTAGARKKVKVEPRSDETEHKDVKPKVTTPSKPSKKGGAAGGPWTPAKKRELAEIVITRGLANVSAEELATLLGVTKQQIRDATQKGKNNLRGRLIVAAERI